MYTLVRLSILGRVETPESRSSLPKVIIVGGGFGGLKAAKAFAKAPLQVTVIDRSNHHLFQPLLYQVATAGLSPADIATPIRSVLRDQKNTDVLMAEVTGIDVDRREVAAVDSRLSYDYLILATGARHGYFGHEAWENYAPGIKTIPDAIAIRQKVLLAFEAAERQSDPANQEVLLTFVIVGGGPTGVEMAGAIAELAHRALAADFHHIDPRQTQVILLEAGSNILATFPPDLADKARRELERLGVDVRTGSRVEEVRRDGVQVNGKWIFSPTIMWAAGVVASPAGKWLGAETDRAGRVIVTPFLSVPNHPEIFVIGDAACVSGPTGKPLPGVAPVAMQQGRYVADYIIRQVEGEKSFDPFQYRNKGNLATVGRRFAIADLGKIKLSGNTAWLAWIAVHIYYLIGFRNRIMVMIQWAWAYITFQRGARLITDMAREEPVVGEHHERS